ncbi:MAG: TolC family protein [Cyanobacteria bacterium P01_F01_bin.150]
MQSAHQTFITVISTAILLGVAEGASAQAKLSSPTPHGEYELTASDSPASESNTLPSLISTDLQGFGSSHLPAPEKYAFSEVSENLRLLEFSPSHGKDEQVWEPIQAVSSAVANTDNELLTAQSFEVDLPALGTPTISEVDKTETAEEATSEGLEAQLPALESADEIPEATSQEDPTPTEEPPVRARPDIAIPSDAEIDDFVEEPSDSSESLIEIPDYLLAPANPLFTPIEPETVEIEGTQPISLEQALEISRRNSRELESALQQLEQSQEALRQQRAAYLPTITSQTTLTHQDVDISNEPVGAPDVQGNPSASLDGDDTVTTNLLSVLRVDYDIFTSGQRSASVRAAEKAVELQQLQVEVVREDLRLNITSAYYDLQESDELVRIAEDTVEQSRISLRDALARERAGVGTRFDRLQAEVDLANDEQALSNALRDQQVTRRQLAEVLSIPPGINISAADPVEVAGEWAMPLEETLVLAYRNRAELEQQLLQREIEQQQKRATLANRWPQLSAFAEYQINDLLDVTRSPTDNEELSVGLQLAWTLYNGGATRAAARQEAIAAELAETQFADTREDIRFDIEQQYLNLGASFKNIQTANSAVGLAEESLRLARLRFGAGVGIQSDVLEAQTRLTEAEVNLVTAILAYNRALVAIQRAVSNFPDNNLSADPVREP